MADNTTTYTAVIETKVTGADEVGDLGDKAEESDGKFKSLRSQIRETTVALQKLADEGKAGTKEFQDLSDELDNLSDQQQRVAFQSAQIEDKLAALPGPIGQIGKSFQAAKTSIDTFGKTIAVSLGIIGLLVSAFLAIKESLSRTEEGQAKLNKISEAFTKIMNGIFAIIEPIANLFADLVIQLLSSEKVMKGLSTVAGVLSATFTTLFNVGKTLVGFIVNNFINAFKTLSEVAGGTGKVLKGVFTFDLDLIKEGVTQVGDGIKKGFTSLVDNVKTTVKGIGTGVVDGIKSGMEQGSKAFTAGTKRLTEAEKKAAAEKKKAALESGKKLTEQEKKELEERNKLIAAGNKASVEAYLATLDARDKDIYNRGLKLNADIEALEKAKQAKLEQAAKDGIKNTKAIEEQFASDLVAIKEGARIDIDNINTKYDDEEAKKLEEKKTKEKEAAKLAYEEAVMNNENQTQIVENRYNSEIALINEAEKSKIDAIKYANSLLLQDETLNEEQRKAIIQLGGEAILEGQTLNEEQRKAIIKIGGQAILDGETLNAEQRKAIIQQGAQAIADIQQQAATDRLAQQTLRYDELIAVINEKEKIALSNVELTEAQKTKIQLDAIAERKAIEQLATEDTILGFDTELERIGTTFDRKRELIGLKEAELLTQEGLTENQRTAIRQQGADERAAIDMAEMEARVAIQNAQLDLAAQFGGLLKSLAGENKKVAIAGVVVEQAAAIGKILVNTGIANAKAVAASPLTFGAPWVLINSISAGLSIASSIAAGAKAVQQINSAGSGGGAASGGGAIPGKSGAGAAPAVPQIERTAVPQITGTTGQASPGAQIAGTLAKSSEKPIRAFVVSGDVTSQQALDRRTTRAATFSGGTNG